MANDKTSSEMYNNLFDRLMPGNRRPGNFVNLGLSARQRNEDNEGVVVPAYDIASIDGDGRPARLSNRQINRMHRMLEAQASTLGGLRDMARVQKVKMHHALMPSSYEVFVETFHDTILTEDADGECVWNNAWGPPTAAAPPSMKPTTSRVDDVDITGKLLHNAHEGSIVYDPDDSETASAGTYRTTNLTAEYRPYEPDYVVSNSFNMKLITDVFAPWPHSTTGTQSHIDTAVIPVVFVHGNKTFWDTYWTGSLDSELKSLAGLNRITIYIHEHGGINVDITKRYVYVPHVQADYVYGSTEDNDTQDNIFGVILNAEDREYRPNSEVVYSSSIDNPYTSYYRDDGFALERYVETLTLLSSNIPTLRNSTNAPAGIINDTNTFDGTRSALRADVTLAPGAKIYSWSLHMVRYADFARHMAGGDRA